MYTPQFLRGQYEQLELGIPVFRFETGQTSKLNDGMAQLRRWGEMILTAQHE